MSTEAWLSAEGEIGRLRAEAARLRAVLADTRKLLGKWSLGPGRGDMVPADELRAALREAAGDEPTTETRVEIGGQRMTQAQFDAARFPLLNDGAAGVTE